MIKSRPCKYEGCTFPRFSKGYCKVHQFARDDYRPIQLKRTRIKMNRQPTGEKALFDSILASQPHKSFLSGKKLSKWDIEGYKCCAHVLSKAKNKYPRYRLLEENIILLTGFEHFLYDYGTNDQRESYAAREGCDWSKVYDLADRLKERYNDKA